MRLPPSWTAPVADGVELPSDVYAYIPDLSTDKYENSIGVSTGTYYAVDGQLYEMVFISQSDPKCQSKAEAINYLFNEQGLVYGQDYDLLRVYNYEEDYSNGPRPDDFDFHCIYAYKAMGSKDAAGLTSNSQYEGAYRNDNSLAVKGDVGTIFAPGRGGHHHHRPAVLLPHHSLRPLRGGQLLRPGLLHPGRRPV